MIFISKNGCKNPKSHPDTSEETELETLELIDKKYQIILYNDDVNTFDHVINCLVSICHHSPEQAEQCAITVHYKGKSDVKSGSYDELKPKCEKLLDEGLSATIESA